MVKHDIDSQKKGAAAYYDLVKLNTMPALWEGLCKIAQQSPNSEDRTLFPGGEPPKDFVEKYKVWRKLADKTTKAEFTEVLVNPDNAPAIKLSNSELEMIRGGKPYVASGLCVLEGAYVGGLVSAVGGGIVGGLFGGLMCAGMFFREVAPTGSGEVGVAKG